MSPFFIVCAMLPSATPEPLVAADLALLNGKVWTVDHDLPEAQAVAVWRHRIIKVGSDAEVKSLVGPKRSVIDLNGRRVLARIPRQSLAFSRRRRAALSRRAERREGRGGVRQATPRIRSQAAARSLDRRRQLGPRPRLRRNASDRGDCRQIRERSPGLHSPLRRPHGPGEHCGAQVGGDLRRHEGTGRRRNFRRGRRQNAERHFAKTTP